MATEFTWIPTYREIAQALLNYENRQEFLLQMLQEMKEKGLPVISVTDQDSKGTNIGLREIDPFTFFANFNRAIRDDNRIQIIDHIIKKMSLSCNTPSDFKGTPSVDMRKAWFFSYKYHREPDAISLLWQLFKEALNPNGITEQTFNKVLQIRGIFRNITYGLFWVSPDIYIPLGKTSVDYFDLNKTVEKKTLTFSLYMEIIEKAKKYNKPFYQISHELWLNAKNKEAENSRLIKEHVIKWDEGELIEGFRQSQKYKEFRNYHLQHKIAREKAAWQLLNENRGQYTVEILNHIFDTIDHNPLNSKLWFGSLLAAPNRNLIFEYELSLINQWIDQLLFSGQKAEISLDACLKKYKIKGASKGLATLLLYLSNPERYNIWVNSTQDGLSVLGYISDLTGQDWGKNYSKFNNAAIDFRKKYELLPQEVDWILTYIGSHFKREDKHYDASNQSSKVKTDLQTCRSREMSTEENKKMNNKDELEFETPLEEEAEVIEIPPEKRKIYTELGDPEIDSLHGKFKRGKLIVQPDFQRQYVWDTTKASRLIESALLSIPIPIIYMSQEMDNKEYVIDGQQRLTSFFSFIDGKLPDGTDFKLTGLKVFRELNGKKYVNLSDDIQDSIRYFKLRTIMFKKDSDQDLRFEIFERLNTGAVSLNDQELRNCIYRGSFNALLKEMSQDSDFTYLLGLKKPDKRMRDIELVLRFSAFYHRTYLNYKPPMKNFLNVEAEKYRDITKDDAQKLKIAFKNTCQIIRSMLGKNAFKRFYKGTEKNPSGYWEPNKFNASLYDILMYTFAREEKSVIYQNLDSIREALIHLMTENQDFIDSIELSTSSVQAVTKRFDLWRLALQDIVGIGKKEPRCFSMQLKEELFKKNNTCAICNQKIQEVDDSAIDHIKQYWTGGKTIPENARLTHRYCNWARSRKE